MFRDCIFLFTALIFSRSYRPAVTNGPHRHHNPGLPSVRSNRTRYRRINPVINLTFAIYIHKTETVENYISPRRLVAIYLIPGYAAHNNQTLCLQAFNPIAATMPLQLLGDLFLLQLSFLYSCRRHLLNKRMSKGPYKIILTATDFVFPQVPDSRRVSDSLFYRSFAPPLYLNLAHSPLLLTIVPRMRDALPLVMECLIS